MFNRISVTKTIKNDEEKDPTIQRLSGLLKNAQTVGLMTKKTIRLVENQSSSGSSGISQL